MMVAILLVIIAVLAVLLISTKLGLTAYIVWMEENHFKQPSNKDMERLIGWCARKYIKDLIQKILTVD